MSEYYSRSYVQELERLILDELLPVYEQWHKESGLEILASRVHPELLRELKKKKTVPALFKPPNIPT